MSDSKSHLENPINQLSNGLAEALESIGFELPINVDVKGMYEKNYSNFYSNS